MNKYIVTIELLVDAERSTEAEAKAKNCLEVHSGNYFFDCQEFPQDNEKQGSFEIVDAVSLDEYYNGPPLISSWDDE